MRLHEFGYFQKNDRIVLLWIVAVIIILCGIFYFADSNDTDEKQVVAEENIKDSTHIKQEALYDVEEIKGEQSLFSFDPNTANAKDLLSLGFTEHQVGSIMKYRKKGGVYRYPEQISKIPGMTRGLYNRLIPYVQIGDDYLPMTPIEKNVYPQYQRTTKVETKESRDTTKWTKKLSPGQTIDLNTADTTQLKMVPNIGSAYAKAIVRYRERLGGFVSLNQLNEIELLPENTHKYFRLSVSDNSIRKIHINQEPLNKLHNHPYLNFYQSRAIVDYRRQKGNIKSLSDLSSIKYFTAADLSRLEKYVEF